MSGAIPEGHDLFVINLENFVPYALIASLHHA